MLSINIICVGKIKENYLKDAISEYSKRLSKYCNLNIIELSDERIELETNSLCTCGAPAKFNARKVDGIFTMEGAEIEIDGARKNVEYVPLCGACFYKEVYRKQRKNNRWYNYTI